MQGYYRLILSAVIPLALVLGLWGLTASGVSADAPVTYVVGWGDTLVSIATRYGSSVNALMQANGIRNPDFIYVGQQLLVPGGAVPGPAPAPATYVVQSGDTLFSIATRNGTTVGALMRANGLYNYWIYVGQTLRIPGSLPQPPAPQPPIPQPVPQPLPQGVYHVVRPGEYLSLIAARYGSSVYAIQIANKISNPSFIWSGQRLFIPGGVAPLNPLPPPAPIYPVYPTVIPYFPPLAPPAPVVVFPSPTPPPHATGWEAVLITNTVGTGPCSLAAIVVGKTDWPVVVATPDGSWISDPKLTGTKPERGPYVVEFAHACTGVWRVIPVGLNVYADVRLNGGHAEVEFHPRAN